MEFIIWVVILGIILRTVYTLGELSGMRIIERQLAEFARKVVEVKVTLEAEGNMIYVFEDGTGKFIIQGEGWDETMKALEAAHPGKVFIADPEKIEEFKKIKKGQ